MTPRVQDQVKMPDILQLLRSLEWGSWKEGMGSGMMGSGGDGRWVPACPSCQNAHPEKGKWEFIPEACGHKSDCKLKEAISQLEAR